MKKILNNSFYLIEYNQEKFIALSYFENFTLGEIQDNRVMQMICFIKKIEKNENNLNNLNKIDYAMIDNEKVLILANNLVYQYIGEYQEVIVDYFGNKELINSLKIPLELFENFFTKN